MVTFLRQVHAPTGEFALMNNFCSLSDMETKTGEALESYMQRIRNAVDLLRGGKIHIHPILITLIAVRGLDSSYEAVKHDLSIQSDKYANLDLGPSRHDAKRSPAPPRPSNRTPPSPRPRPQSPPTPGPDPAPQELKPLHHLPLLPPILTRSLGGRRGR